MKKILLLILILSTTHSFSQKKDSYLPKPTYEQLFKTIQPVRNDAPKWVHLMYSKNVNFYQLQKSYKDYYSNHILKKTTHTQNYKFFVSQVTMHGYLQEYGRVFIPKSKSDYDKKVTQLYKNRGVTDVFQARNTTSANQWTAIGPFETYTNGSLKSSQVNVYTFEQSTANPNLLYAATETGGFFKSTDKGLHWFAVGSDFFTESNITAIAIDPNNDNIVYVGRGRKLYKTVDGGTTWQEMLDQYALDLNAITINPNDGVIMISGNRGVKRSANGGQSWRTVFSDTCWDIKLKTDDPNTIFVLKNNPRKNITEFFKSTDNGQSFTVKSNGWFVPINGVASNDGGARMAVTNADSNRIYVVLLGNEDDNVDDNNYIGIYRSDNAGESWSMPYDGNNDGTPDNEPGGPYSNDHWCLSGFNVTATSYSQGYYDLDIAASDTNPDNFLVGFLNLYKSENGGAGYTKWGGYQCAGCGAGYRHPDIQEIEINGDDVWVASDGGIDYYDANFDFISSRKNGINGADYWGFGQGWNEDVLVGGRYHNGNAAHYQAYGVGNFISLGGGEAPTGYVNQGESRKVYHSDISAYLIPETLNGSVQAIPNYSKFPNQHYLTYEKGELVTHPYYWNTLFLGKDNKLWKSEDGGNTFNLLHTFGTNSSDLVMSIEISRNNPSLIYATQSNNKLWKSTNAGTSWSLVNTPNSSSIMYISLNTEDKLFLALTTRYTSTQKVYKTNDGGAHWINLSSNTLYGVKLIDICAQKGTNGGVYVSDGTSFWYRNNTMADWQIFSAGLPLDYYSRNMMIPFYKESKMRSAGNRGIWERDFFESSLPKAQPMVKNKNISCYFDEIQFEDHSILNHNGATWQWDFPGASYVSSTTVRNPIVKYPSYGNYDVTLTITDAQGHSDSKTMTNFVQVGNACQFSTQDSDSDALSDVFENSVCTIELPQSIDITSGNSVVISNFEGNTSGSYYADLNFYTNCSQKSANIKAIIDLNNQEILVSAYTHFASTSTTDIILNNNTSEVSSEATDFSEIAIQLVDNATTGEKNLVFKVLSNACGTTTRMNVSCLGNLDYDNDGTPNYLDVDSDNDGISDTAETQACGNSIPATSYFGSGTPQTAIDFGNHTDGIYFVTIYAKTNCYGVTSTFKARINLQQQIITVVDYDHFGNGFSNDMIGNGTNEVVSAASGFAKFKYKLDYNQSTHQYKFLVTQVSNACGSISRLESGSCWSNLDTDNNGKIDYLDNPALNINENATTFSKVIPYPNPTKHQTVGFKNLNTNFKFILFDTSGKELIKKSFKRGEKVDLKYLSSGTYFFQVETENRIQNGKIIVD